MSTLIAGWVAIDDVETPFAKTTGALGGSATFTVLAASLFTDVRLLAAVGEDFPDRFRQQLARPNVDLAGLTVEGPETSRWGAKYSYDMNSRETLYTVLGVNAGWQPKLPPGWDGSTTACMSALDPVMQRNLIRALPHAKASLVDTIKFFIETSYDELRTTMTVADFVTLNEDEARQVAGMPSIARAGRKFVEEGVRGMIIKLGEYGAVYMSRDDYFVAPGYPLEDVVDPTGAGDAFAGGFLGYLDTVPAVTPHEVRRAMIYASTVASFCVEGFGPARLLTLTRDEVEARYRQFRSLTHFEVE
ncbi:MAG: PfkB family carbohydrate kinase [Dehalococcoidia bacterium]